MTYDFDKELARRIAEIREAGLFRELRRVDSAQSAQIEVCGRTLLNFSSNDYLGLANEPLLKESAIRAIEKFGVGSGAARLISGSLAPHHELESAIAEYKRTEGALSFSTGYATALGAICALLGKDDVIVLDKLVHASIVDAARLCGAKIRVFVHNDLNQLEKILRWADARGATSVRDGPPSSNDASAQNLGLRRSRTLIVTESVFSMDGDFAPLAEIVALKEQFGAWLMVDEAHATGVYGEHGRGRADTEGLAGRIEIQMGTLGKAVGAAGGFIAGSRTLIDWLVNRARSFIFSTAPIPAAAAAATAGIRLVQSSEGETRRRRLFELIGRLCSRGPWGAQPTKHRACPILPLQIGDETAAVAAAAALRERGMFVPAIRYPTVARHRARLRFTVTASHRDEEVSALQAALAELGLDVPPEISGDERQRDDTAA